MKLLIKDLITGAYWARRQALYAELDRLSRAEDSALSLLNRGMSTPIGFTATVLVLRDRQAAVMDELGWTDKARELRADTAMRRNLAG